MTPEYLIVALPYLVSIGLKIVSLVLDRRTIENTLLDLINLNKPAKQTVTISEPQVRVMVDHVSHAMLKTTVITTSFLSFVSAVAIAMAKAHDMLLNVALAGFVVIGFCLVLWVHSKEVFYFNEPGWFGIKRDVWATMWFCFYDVLLAASTVWSVYRDQHQFD